MIMSTRLKKLLALSMSISLAATGIFIDVGMRSVTAAASKTKRAKDKKNVKKVKVTVAQKKTIKAPKSEKKAVWSILSGKQNISVIKKGKGEIKIKAQKSGNVKLQAKQGKKKTIYNITVKKQAPKKSEIKQLTKFYKECFIKSSKEMGNDWYAEGDDFLHDKWIEWDDYGYIRGMSLESTDTFTEIDLPRFKKIKYFGSFWGMSKLKKLDLGNNPTLECVFLKNVDVEDDTIFENLNEINVSKCKNLRVIDIEQAGEKFTELDLSSNDKLNSLGLEGLRGLKQLKMPETDNLKELVVKETALESLDIEKYTKLDKVCIGGNQFNTLKINMEQKTEKDIENMYLLFDNNLKVEFISSKNGIVPNIKRLDNHNLWAGIVFSNYVVTDYEIPECW